MTDQFSSGKIETELLDRYQNEFTSSPEWAFPSKQWDNSKNPLRKPFPPSIPFVGKNYNQAPKKIVLYASAENLAHYERKPETIPDFLCDDRAWNRHRAANVEGWDKFFPRLHIGPVENGSLLCAVLFICNSLGLDSPKDPKLFLENLAVANLGKFSIAGNKSVDYAGNIRMLKPSLPFFQVDLEVLQPDILILPKTMHAHQIVRDLISEIVPNTHVIPVLQFNSTVVNIHLKRNDLQAIELAAQYKGTVLEEWTNHLTGYRKGYPFRYYSELESI
ncbi:MAG: hypothetical protein G3M78_02460 [Candidatus Nitrohelix vancouverensis]|uniref:Uncharacterized protein n=1 Tax=Candidatus Nitrohelix vancouverensis TaxID=2705534 RepID=A0A7T0C0J3_9BACT|nr:MAG: hypothetical protein G3M78_02460 [Candidatus Nitrohelix vancouverensis]